MRRTASRTAGALGSAAGRPATPCMFVEGSQPDFSPCRRRRGGSRGGRTARDTSQRGSEAAISYGGGAVVVLRGGARCARGLGTGPRPELFRPRPFSSLPTHANAARLDVVHGDGTARDGHGRHGRSREGKDGGKGAHGGFRSARAHLQLALHDFLLARPELALPPATQAVVPASSRARKPEARLSGCARGGRERHSRLASGRALCGTAVVSPREPPAETQHGNFGTRSKDSRTQARTRANPTAPVGCWLEGMWKTE